jgi:NitT/TauT family transport system ATP-binding protein
MDEPFGSLDALTRTKLQTELNQIVSRTHVTIVFVTHSIEEAIVLGTRVVVLSHPPSVVREIVSIPPGAKQADSSDYLQVRLALRRLLNLEGEEESYVAPFE